MSQKLFQLGSSSVNKKLEFKMFCINLNFLCYFLRVLTIKIHESDISFFPSGVSKSSELNFLRTPAGNYMFKVNNRNTRTRCEICSKLTIKIPERQRRSSVFFVNFEHISHLVLAFLLLTLNR